MLIKRRRGWELPESAATPEHLYWNRRKFVRAIAVDRSSRRRAALRLAARKARRRQTRCGSSRERAKR